MQHIQLFRTSTTTPQPQSSGPTFWGNSLAHGSSASFQPEEALLRFRGFLQRVRRGALLRALPVQRHQTPRPEHSVHLPTRLEAGSQLARHFSAQLTGHELSAARSAGALPTR